MSEPPLEKKKDSVFWHIIAIGILVLMVFLVSYGF